jgi:plasmid stabilization system protein ParE
MMPHGNYLAFYKIHGTEVRIGHIRHGARKPFAD